MTMSCIHLMYTMSWHVIVIIMILYYIHDNDIVMYVMTMSLYTISCRACYKGTIDWGHDIVHDPPVVY